MRRADAAADPGMGDGDAVGGVVGAAVAEEVIVGAASAEVTTAAAGSAGLSAGAALGCAATVSPTAGPRWCHGFHQTTPATSSTAATNPTIDGQGKWSAAGVSVRSLTVAGCDADGLGACTRDS